MEYIAKFLTKYFVSKNLITEEEREIYEYGFDITLYTIISTVMLLLYGAICGYWVDTAILIFIFYRCQSNGGGYHANTHWRCFVTMFIGLNICLLLCSFKISPYMLLVVGISGFVCLWSIPVVLHKHKKYLETEMDRLIPKSRKSTIVCGIVLMITLFYFPEFMGASCWGIAAATVSRLYANFQNK